MVILAGLPARVEFAPRGKRQMRQAVKFPLMLSG